MAYPLTCQGALDALAYGSYLDVLSSNYAAVHREDAAVHYNANQDHAAIQDIILCLYDVIRPMGHTNYGWNPFNEDGAIVWYLENCISAPEPYELTFEKICEAWMADDFKGASLTIAFIDRMRQLIWDEPFNVIWAARPSV